MLYKNLKLLPQTPCIFTFIIRDNLHNVWTGLKKEEGETHIAIRYGLADMATGKV